MSALPYMPLDPAWLEGSQAFFHEDPRLARARMQLLLACWRGVPAASIPNAPAYVAGLTHLPPQDVETHWELLTEGMAVTSEGRLRHEAMHALWEGMSTRYGTVIDDFATATAMSMQDSEQFSLVAVEGGKAKSKKAPTGKTQLPKGFGYQMYPDLIAFVHGLGCTEDEDKSWMMKSYLDYCESRGELAKGWQAHFRLWSRRQIEHFKAVPPSKRQMGMTVVGGRPATVIAPSRAEAATQRNLERFARAGGVMQPVSGG